MSAPYQRLFKANHRTQFADEGRQLYALKKCLMGFVMGTAVFVCGNSLDAQTLTGEGNNFQDRTPRDNKSTAAATAAQIPILAQSTKPRSLAELQGGLRAIAAKIPNYPRRRLNANGKPRSSDCGCIVFFATCRSRISFLSQNLMPMRSLWLIFAVGWEN